MKISGLAKIREEGGAKTKGKEKAFKKGKRFNHRKKGEKKARLRIKCEGKQGKYSKNARTNSGRDEGVRGKEGESLKRRRFLK